jgi:plasmid replication initiation protein
MQENLGLTQDFVISSNDLIEAKYNYSLWEKRVFVYMISTMKRDDTGFKPVRIVIRDLMRFFNTNSNNDYSAIRAIPETISRKPFYVPYHGKEGGKRWNIINVLSIGSQPDIGDRSEGNAYIELKFNSDLMPYLLELKEKFTKYDIRNITSLKSIYSIRVYEYLKENQWRRGVFEVTVEELKDMFFMSAKDNDGKELYPLYADFKKRVLLKAQEDLLEYCDIKFNFWEKKHGKKVVSLAFEIMNNDKTKAVLKIAEQDVVTKVEEPFMSSKKMKQELYNELFSRAKVLDISESTLRMVVDSYSSEAVRQGFEYTMSEFNKGKIKENIDGYFIIAVKNGFTSSNFEKEQAKKRNAIARQKKEAEQNQLKQELLDLEQNIVSTQKTIIKTLVAIDSNLVFGAIEKAKIEIENSPNLLKYVQEHQLNLDTAAVEIWRKDRMLADLVQQAIFEIRPEAFSVTEELYKQRKTLIGKLSLLEKQ